MTYKTELEVSNDDLSLRPGMTASAEISVAGKTDVLLVPNAALRFDPDAQQAKAGAPQKKTFVQSLIPGPPRRQSGRPQAGDEGGQRGSGPARIWILRDGKPQPVPVKVGLSDGRATEVSGEGLTEGMPVVLYAVPPK